MPYGRAPFLLGLRAVDALYDLCDVTGPDNQAVDLDLWTASDLRSLQGWFNVEEKADPAHAALEAGSKSAYRLAELLDKYRVALPFSEAERHWLLAAYDQAWGPESIATIRAQTAEVVSAGVRARIVGAQLIRRWASWRRQADEYQDRGTVNIAQGALLDMITTYSPNLEVPDTYFRLRSGITEG